MKSVTFHIKGEKQSVTRKQALRVARQLGCSGAHQKDDGSWMPCASDEAFVAIQKSENEYLRVSAKARSKTKSILVHRVELLESKSAMLYVRREDAVAVSKQRGCRGVRTVILAGTKYFAPCTPADEFEDLGQRGVAGITTLPDGGLISTPKTDDETDIDSKGFVNFVSRATDPDVYSNPDSARIRSSNLGCIGIRRYTSREGYQVWLPCSNGSDYNRVTGLGGDNKPRRRPTWVPALRNMRPARPPVANPRSVKSAKDIDIDAQTVNSLAVKVREHNAKMDKAKREIHTKTNLRVLKTVYLRGMSASPDSKKDAMKRVVAFLKMLDNGQPDDLKYRSDNDLLSHEHPWRIKKSTAKKMLATTEGVHGIKLKGGCCPKKVIRYYPL